MNYAYAVISLLFWGLTMWFKGNGRKVDIPFAVVMWGSIMATIWLISEGISKLWGLF